MRCYRRSRDITYKQHVTDEEVRNKIQDEIGKHDDFLSLVKTRKLRWNGHILKASGSARDSKRNWTERKTEIALRRQHKGPYRSGRICPIKACNLPKSQL